MAPDEQGYGKKMSGKSMNYDGATPHPKLRVASKVNKGGMKKAKSSGGKSSGASKMW